MRGTDPAVDPMALTISTIVCAYNEADYDSSAPASSPFVIRPVPWTRSVVNNASTDETVAIATSVRWRPRDSTSRARDSCRAREAGRLCVPPAIFSSIWMRIAARRRSGCSE